MSHPFHGQFVNCPYGGSIKLHPCPCNERNAATIRRRETSPRPTALCTMTVGAISEQARHESPANRMICRGGSTPHPPLRGPPSPTGEGYRCGGIDTHHPNEMPCCFGGRVMNRPYGGGIKLHPCPRNEKREAKRLPYG